MSGVRAPLLPVLDRVRQVLGPGTSKLPGLDLRPTSVTIIQQVWSNGQVGDGTPTVVSTLTLSAGALVRQVSEREVADSGGRLEVGDVSVERLTPAYGPSPIAPKGGGYAEAQLDPPVTDEGVENVYRLALQSGASGVAGDYRLVSFKRDDPLEYKLVLRRRATTP